MADMASESRLPIFDFFSFSISNNLWDLGVWGLYHLCRFIENRLKVKVDSLLSSSHRAIDIDIGQADLVGYWYVCKKGLVDQNF